MFAFHLQSSLQMFFFHAECQWSFLGIFNSSVYAFELLVLMPTFMPLYLIFIIPNYVQFLNNGVPQSIEASCEPFCVLKQVGSEEKLTWENSPDYSIEAGSWSLEELFLASRIRGKGRKITISKS